MWLGATNRDQVTAAVEAVERKLRERPIQSAERQVEGLYLISEPPLHMFTVDDVSSIVTIIRIGISTVA